ncbi:Adenylate kinase [Acaryochloris thomasi RCC1774]|uniref:Adenylate kinase n=1 Tax=Acaryochloris thomasi RCC1774 TaxID=1764569 RepID=A0A2W1JHL6_9CYAN|nr:adenylate kinase [Acaryochloris thomasi]PZD72836.1 Adenylate kinase [Acaryochloris thomasi RCC1774]
MRLIILGPPGSGKGTQAEKLASQANIPHISTGELLRIAISQGTSLGKQARTFVESGDLVPDSLVIALMRERLGQQDAQQGWILDGFPCNLTQAHALDSLLQIMGQPYGTVIHLDVEADKLTQRMLQRGRQDDQANIIQQRLAVYQQQTAPLIDFYQRRRCLTHIDGSPTAEIVNSAIQKALKVPVAA